MGEAAYVGTELELFRHAVRWKRYFSGVLRPYVRGRVLDVGCGMGVNAEYLWNPAVSAYTFLEPDPDLLAQVNAHVSTPALRQAERIRGTTADLEPGSRFDTVMYLDVLEHISDSHAELRRASDLLVPGGHLLVVVPAFNMLYSPFDKAIGHHRRYTRKLLRSELPSGTTIVRARYLDCLGALLSLGNKLLLRNSAPTMAQVLFWDRTIVPMSRVVDPLMFRSFGRSLISVVRKV
ncbi:MAG: class I SAM-dependent methyltransferase [Flavobacteriales bacterium]|jgi:2-polyprenyl-3-methyl-5-hydroxy-6-metoxy-1,4-benzoquinol methylase|nr:class I SAM-dependent methyltransferase [Flavobacteriales bacterium]